MASDRRPVASSRPERQRRHRRWRAFSFVRARWRCHRFYSTRRSRHSSRQTGHSRRVPAGPHPPGGSDPPGHGLGAGLLRRIGSSVCLRSAPFIFNQFAEGWHWILQHNHGVRFLLHYLDDFLTAGAPASSECQRNLHVIEAPASLLGIPLAAEKVEGPTSRLTFLGIELDTTSFTARLPNDKLVALRQLLAQWSNKRVFRVSELQSLLGHLHYASKVVYPGRPFLRRLTDLLRGHRRAHHFIRLSREARDDIRWWWSFVRDWNGANFFTFPRWSQLSDLQVASDASGSIGYAAFLNGDWFAGRWLPAQASASIAYKELFPIVLAAHVWGPRWERLRIQFLCDNEGVSRVINRRFCSDPALGAFLRALSLAAARHSFWVSATHIPGRTNGIADALSRFQFQRFRLLAPTASAQPTPVPPELLQQLSSHTSSAE